MVTIEVCCPQCKCEFEVDEVENVSLRDAIEDAVDEAVDQEQNKADSSFYAAEEPLDPATCRLLGDLACAVRVGDRGEAELLLDRIAEEIGGLAQHEVSVGRFRRNPLLAA